jgi:pimeloyl-ACP methyl ester carboxylesterase
MMESPQQPAAAPGDPATMSLSVPVSVDVSLHVRHRPGPAAPPVLLVHGLESNARTWDLVAARLAGSGHPVYAVDLRGHGESDHPDVGYDTATAAADVAAVCRYLGLTGVVVAGHSWGAHVVLRLTAEHPSLVSAMALVEGGWADPARVYGSWEVFSAVCMSLVSPAATAGGTGAITIDRMREYLQALHPDWIPAAVEASLFSMRVGTGGTLTPPLSVEQRTEILRSLWGDPPASWYPAVGVPALLLPAVPKISTGWRSSIRDLVDRIRASVDDAAAGLAQATVSEYPDSDHDLHAQHPDGVARDLLALARKVA